MSVAESLSKQIAEKRDPVAYLTGQHREVENLFDDLANATGAAREECLATLVAQMRLHTQVEEEVFYPAVKRVDADQVAQAHVEHDLVKTLIEKVHACEEDDPTFRAKINVLRDLVRHHVMSEEQELFAKVWEAMSEDELEQIWEEMQAAEERILRATEPTQGP